MSHKCANCGECKSAKYKHQVCSDSLYYCSDECLFDRYKLKRGIYCKHCGKKITDTTNALQYENMKGTGTFCSTKCAFAEFSIQEEGLT